MKISYLDKYFYVTSIKDKYHFIVYEDKMTDSMAKYFIDNGFTNRLEVLTR